MALYVAELVVPPMTPESNPVSVEIFPTVGRLVSGAILFPDGCLWVVGARVLDYGNQIAPFPTGDWIFENNNWVSWKEYPPRNLIGSPYRLKIEGWSDALDYPHTLLIRFEIIQ